VIDDVELTARISKQLREQKRVDKMARRMDREIDAIEEMRTKLSNVVSTYVPSEGDAEMVVVTIDTWLQEASKSMIRERLAKRHEIKAYDVDMADELTSRYGDGWIPEEPVDIAEVKEPERWPLTNWLLLAVMSLEVAQLAYMMIR
jgi:hypothetical protein